MNPYNSYTTYTTYGNDDRFFPIAAFGLGALTGGVAVAAFNPYRPRPYYPVGPAYPMYPGPRPYYY